MRILFAGTPAVAVPPLDVLAGSGHELVGVLTRADAPGKRGRQLVPSPVARRAAELGLPVHKPLKAREPEFVARVAELAPDVCIAVAYGQLISASLLAVPEHGWLNLHFSLLPRWRGAAPVQRAIMAGDTETGACVFELVPELDAGPVYGTIREPLHPGDTADAVLDRLAHKGSGLLLDTLDAIAAGTRPVPQPETGITAAPKLTVAEAELDWSRSAVDLDRQIRGCHSNPGAWTTFCGERFKVGLGRLAGSSADGPDRPPAPGQLRATKRTLLVGTGTDPLELLQVQAFGKKPMSGADWARGVALGPDDRLGA